MNNPSSSETLETNAYGRTLHRQQAFLNCLITWGLPDTGDLYNRTNKTDTTINWFNAWENVAASPLYATYKQSEQALFTKDKLQAICTNDVLNNLKKASYIVDLWCGDSKTTIFVLEQLIQSGLITTKNLQNKTIIIFDDSGIALGQAQQNWVLFFKKHNIGFTLKAQKGNRNNLKPWEKLLDEYSGDKFIFSTGFTIGNLDETSKNKFCAFDPRHTHTLLATYFVKPDKSLIPFVEATYGKKVIEENPEKNNLPEKIKEIRNTDNLTAMHNACTAQFTHILRASGRSDQDVDDITITSRYNTDTGTIEAWFEPNNALSIHVWAQVFNFEKEQFYPLLTSTRFDANEPPVAKNHISRNNNDLVWCSVHVITKSNKVRNTMNIMSMVLILSLVAWWYRINAKNIRNQEKNILLIEMLKNRMPADHYLNTLPHDTLLWCFHGRVTEIGNILNTIYDTKKFTTPWSIEYEILEQYCFNNTELFFELNQRSQSPDRYIEQLNRLVVALATQYAESNSLLLMGNSQNELIRNTAFRNALQNTSNLSFEQAQSLNNIYAGSDITLIGVFPTYWYDLSSLKLFGTIMLNDTVYAVSLDSYLSNDNTNLTLSNSSLWFQISPNHSQQALNFIDNL